eukprot:536252-Pleurochrysis_carterae.AAC.1
MPARWQASLAHDAAVIANGWQRQPSPSHRARPKRSRSVRAVRASGGVMQTYGTGESKDGQDLAIPAARVQLTPALL